MHYNIFRNLLTMSKNTNKGIKAQEWMILFDGKIKRTEKVLYLDPSLKENSNNK